MISRRHAETDAALEFCKKHSLLLALDTETPQDQLKIASGVIVDALRTWRDDIRANTHKSMMDVFSNSDIFGNVVNEKVLTGAAATSSTSSSSSNSFSGVEAGAPPLKMFDLPGATNGTALLESEDGGDEAHRQEHPTIFRGPNYFWSVGFLRFRRLAHSRFRLRDILRRYMTRRRDFIEQAMQQWRELELTARLSLPFDQFVLVFVPLELRRQVLVDFHCACAHQCVLFLRATRWKSKEEQMQLRQTFFVWAFHERRTSSTTFRIAVVAITVLRERMMKRAWVRALLKGNNNSNSSNDDNNPAFGRNSRVASLLLAGCTAPTQWCKSLLSLQSLAWCYAIRKHSYRAILEKQNAFVYSDVAAEAKLAALRASLSRTASNASSNNSSTSVTSSLELNIELQPSRLALVFAPWVNAEVTALWFAIHLQKFALRNKESAPSGCEVAHVTNPHETWHRTMNSPEIFAPFSFVDLVAAGGDAKPELRSLPGSSSVRFGSSLMIGGNGNTRTVLFDLERKKYFESQQKQQQQGGRRSPTSEKLQSEYVFRGRRVFEDDVNSNALPPVSLSQKNLEIHLQKQKQEHEQQQQQQQQQAREKVTVGADGALVSAKKKVVHISNEKDQVFAASSPTAATTTRPDSPTAGNDAGGNKSNNNNSSLRRSRSITALNQAPTRGQLFSREQLRLRRQEEFEYAHNFSFLESGGTIMSAILGGGTTLQRSRSSSVLGINARRASASGNDNNGNTSGKGNNLNSNNNDPLRALLNPHSSFRRKINSLVRSSSVRLPASRSFRGIASSFTGVATAPAPPPSTGLAPTVRCPTLWGSAWVTDPHWTGQVENVEQLYFDVALAQSMYRRVLHLCVMTGALAITDAYKARRLERVNRMMIEQVRLERESEGGQSAKRAKKRRTKEQKQQKQEQQQESERRDEEPVGRLQWTPKQRREPVRVCQLFGDLSQIEPADVLHASTHQAALKSARPPQLFEEQQQQQQSLTLSPYAPLFLPQARPPTPSRHVERQLQQLQQQRRLMNTKQAEPSPAQATAKQPREPAKPKTPRPLSYRPPPPLFRSASARNSISSSSKNVVVDTKLVTVDEQLKNEAAVQELEQSQQFNQLPFKQLEPIVRGASANRKLIRRTATEAALRVPGGTTGFTAAEIIEAVGAAGSEEVAQIQQQRQEQQGRVTVPIDVRQSEFHQRYDGRKCWTANELPQEAPQPFGFTRGFPAIFRVISGSRTLDPTPPKF